MQTLKFPAEPRRWSLRVGDALDELGTLAPGSVDAAIVDPPYCSGAGTRSAKAADPVAKYAQNGRALGRPSFGGDNRSERGYHAWASVWLRGLLRALRPGGYLLVFTDWRMLATVHDAVDAAGHGVRGLISWDKGEGARSPGLGWFRHQCEYVVWTCKGKPSAKLVLPGAFRVPVRQTDKHHLTGKPTELLRRLVQVAPPGGVVLDCFAGSATTGVAALLEGRRAVLIEESPAYAAIAERRLAAAERGELLAWDRRLAA